MNFHVLTLFPEMIRSGLHTSITGRALEKGLLSLNLVNIRDFSQDKHKRVDDYPYGGGAGMVMAPGPVYRSYEALREQIDSRRLEAGSNKPTKPRLIYLTPQGKVFNQEMAKEYAKEEDLIFLCGHYEGIDERVYKYIDLEISLGDFILTGGEMAAIPVIDSILRLKTGVLGKEESYIDESFSDGLLEYPQYTRPEDFEGDKVPDVLLSGHHENIRKWRRAQSLIITKRKRVDLYNKITLTKEDKKILEKYK